MALGTRTANLAVVSAESAVLIEARSSVGLISFGTTAVRGEFRGALVNGEIDVNEPSHASLVVPVTSLTSGNALYDAELHDRLNAQRYPEITAELRTADAVGPGRFSVSGDLTIHGTTRRQIGTLAIAISKTAAASPEQPGARTAAPVVVTGLVVVVSGTLIVDIRDFDIELPGVLMLQIYPDVTVSFRVTAISADTGRTDN
ncbi:MAG: YceI family protein [Jatrophihabitantaceae bacterium]